MHPFLACSSITSLNMFQFFAEERRWLPRLFLLLDLVSFAGSWSYEVGSSTIDWQCLATVLRKSLRISSFPVSNTFSNIPCFLLTHIVNSIRFCAFFLFQVSFLYPLQSSSLSFWKLQVQDFCFALRRLNLSFSTCCFLVHHTQDSQTMSDRIWMGPSFGRSRRWQFYWPVIRD